MSEIPPYWITLPLAVSVALTGCAATADFVDLTKEVTYVRTQQKELKAQLAALKELATDLDLALTDLRRDHEEGMRRIASVPTSVRTGRASKATDRGVETASDPGADASPCAASDMPVMEPDIQAFVPPNGATQDQSELSPREAFEVAYQDYQAGDYDSAIQGFKAFERQFPDASLAVDAQYLVGTSYFRTRNCVRAIAAYEKMVKTFPHHKNNSLGLLKLSYLYDAMGDTAHARSVLLQLIDRHPRSKEAKLARRRLPDVSQ